MATIDRRRLDEGGDQLKVGGLARKCLHAIRGNRQQLVALSGPRNCMQSAAISSNQKQSAAISSNQWPTHLHAIIMQSVAISSTQWPTHLHANVPVAALAQVWGAVGRAASAQAIRDGERRRAG